MYKQFREFGEEINLTKLPKLFYSHFYLNCSRSVEHPSSNKSNTNSKPS